MLYENTKSAESKGNKYYYIHTWISQIFFGVHFLQDIIPQRLEARER